MFLKTWLLMSHHPNLHLNSSIAFHFVVSLQKQNKKPETNFEFLNLKINHSHSNEINKTINIPFAHPFIFVCAHSQTYQNLTNGPF